ncbi:MAG: NAD(P)H-hydrate epimerase [Candidatus Omnitrophica bacterium]|nr:NAD(P)H-hydrate epimerase [Candidatus Omnitrophota bacterium]
MEPVDAQTMRQIDLKAQETFGIPELLLMENAGRETAQVILEILNGKKGTVAFFCGKGNNGGDGFVAARHLFLQGRPVALFFIGEETRLKGSAKINFGILKRFRCPLYTLPQGSLLEETLSRTAPLIMGVDALLGIGLKGEVQEPYRSAIECINRLSCPILAVDIPSGLCATTGKVLGCSVKASQTVTFGLPKKGFYVGEGPQRTGKVIVRNIGYPQELL